MYAPQAVLGPALAGAFEAAPDKNAASRQGRNSLEADTAARENATALRSKKIDWRPAGKREQPLGKQHEHRESEHQKEQRSIPLNSGTMKSTFSGHGASTSLLVLETLSGRQTEAVS
jgi:hypothetical protein